MLVITQEDEITGELKSLSFDGAYTSPFFMSLSGDVGGAFDKKMYLRNDDSTKYYDSVSLVGKPLKLVSRGNPLYPEAPFKLKLIQQDTQPSESDWAQVEAGNSLSIGNIGTYSSANTNAISVWARLEVPSNMRQQELRSISITLNYEENNVV